jgi:hypothetical protein
MTVRFGRIFPFSQLARRLQIRAPASLAQSLQLITSMGGTTICDIATLSATGRRPEVRGRKSEVTNSISTAACWPNEVFMPAMAAVMFLAQRAFGVSR